jgi:hypothetical protein
MMETADSSATSIISTTLPDVKTQKTTRTITTSLTLIWILSWNFVFSYHLPRVFPVVTPYTFMIYSS